MLGDLKQIICDNHYTRSWPSGKSYAYTYEDAIVVFSIPANMNAASWLLCQPNRVWELTRLWAPDGHRRNLLTEAISFSVKQFHRLDRADALISYADPNVGHTGGIYKAASWVSLGQSEEVRAYRGLDGAIIARRAFHSGSSALTESQILSRGYVRQTLPGKLRFARGITRAGKKAVAEKLKRLEES